MNQDDDEEMLNNDEQNNQPKEPKKASALKEKAKEKVQGKALSKAGQIAGGALGGPAGAAIGKKVGEKLPQIKNAVLGGQGNNLKSKLLNKAVAGLGNASDMLGNAKNNTNENGEQKGLAEQAKDAAKEKVKVEVKKKVMTWIMANLPVILPVLGIILVIIIVIFIIIFIIVIIAGYVSNNNNNDGNVCSEFSLTTTSLSKADFIAKLDSATGSKDAYSILQTNAGKIYDISVKNGLNPELVIARAEIEGYSPGGSSNNYWGLTSGGKFMTFTTLDQAVYQFSLFFAKYDNFHDSMYKYAVLNSSGYWLNPGGTGSGGCYYFPHIKQYMSEARASVVAEYCAEGKTCSGSSCLASTDEDQEAYTQFNMQRMLDVRQRIFGIGKDNCDESGSATDNDGTGDFGAKVAAYAVKTFDSYQYSQGKRMLSGYVDCSSMVYRAYMAYNVLMGGSPQSGNTASGEYDWCSANNKMVDESELVAGDLIFYHTSSGGSKRINHVEMYIGNGKKFGAHTHYESDSSKDVSVNNYTSGIGYCRPYK